MQVSVTQNNRYWDDDDIGDRQDDSTKLDTFHYRGAALGGWMVLEPWITPSLFYQFLGIHEIYGADSPNHYAFDSKTFCTALGKKEANKQLRRHWKTWVTEEQIVLLKNSGADTVRIPVGDWMYVPYEPYDGCWDGSLDELDRVLRLCEKHGLAAIIDIHAMRGSQNGLDNSGDTANFFWTDSTHYRHWRVRGANWIGHYNQSINKYDTYNRTHIDFSLSVVKEVIDHHKDDPVVVGLEPVNEPWEHTPLDILKSYYYKVNALVREHVPKWMCLMHDSFRPTVENWASFFKLCDKCALDMHLYQAWFPPMANEKFIELACVDGQKIHDLESAGVPVIVGEWSLATDNCAMWLNGLNDNLPGYPLVECARKPCPPPYMGPEQPGAPVPVDRGPVDPFGMGGPSYVINGTCEIGKPLPHDDDEMTALSLAKLRAYDDITHGNFFWNFRTEIEPRWSLLDAVKMGWMPATHDYALHEQIKPICTFEKYHAPLDDDFESDTTPAARHAAEHDSSSSYSSGAYGAVWVYLILTAAVFGVLGYAFGRRTAKRAPRGAGYEAIVEGGIAMGSPSSSVSAESVGISLCRVQPQKGSGSRERAPKADRATQAESHRPCSYQQVSGQDEGDDEMARFKI